MMDKIASATVFPKLRLMLEGDTKALRSFIKGIEKDDIHYDMIDSLLDSKEHLLGMIPDNPEGIGGASSPPQRLASAGYEGKILNSDSSLINTLHEVECQQMEFVKNNMSYEGMPKDLGDMLETILNVYTKITEQLGRSKKTSQPNIIVI